MGTSGIFFNTLYDVAVAVKEALGSLSPEFYFQHRALTLDVENSPLAEISPTHILLLGKNINSFVIPSIPLPTSKRIPIGEVRKFLRAMSTSFLRLNHLGICYAVPHIQTEVERYKKLVGQHKMFHLYEEESESSTERWYFIGNINHWEAPMFEIVLKKSGNTHDVWIPHVQIDLDTNLSIAALENMTTRYLGEGFIKWRLDVPGLGTVLAMGILGDVNGTKIVLGLGTNKRNAEYLRTNLLKVVL